MNSIKLNSFIFHFIWGSCQFDATCSWECLEQSGAQTHKTGTCMSKTPSQDEHVVHTAKQHHYILLFKPPEHIGTSKQQTGTWQKKKKKSKIGSENFSRLGSPELVHPISRNQKSKNWIISGIDHWASPADGRIPLKPPGYQERGKQQHDISSYRNPEETQAELCAGHVGEMIINKQNHEQTLGKSPFSIPNEKADFSNQTLIL